MPLTCLSASDYVTVEAYARESRALFHRHWVPVCRSEDVAEPGDLLPATIGEAQVLIVRDMAGRLAALSNVCRHRSMLLVASKTRGGIIRCPYHLWAYGLDGALTGAPFMGDVSVEGCDLPRYAVTEWGGFVLVNLSGEATPFAELIAPLNDRLQPERLAGLKIGFRVLFQHDWNWKVMLENFGESYHHIGTHAQTLQPLWPGGQTDSSASTGHWIDLRHPNHPQAGALEVYVVFPLLLLALTPASGGAVWYRMAPLGPEKIELEITGIYPPAHAADAAYMASSKAQIIAIHQEDIAACARVQAGLRSPDAVLGPLSPLEAGIARFREWVADQTSRTLAG